LKFSLNVVAKDERAEMMQNHQCVIKIANEIAVAAVNLTIGSEFGAMNKSTPKKKPQVKMQFNMINFSAYFTENVVFFNGNLYLL
jgi:hypothetical protein